MLLPSHRFQLGRRHHYRVGRDEDQETDNQYKDHILDITLVLFGPSHPPQRLPQVIVRAQEQDPDHRRLDDEEPGQQPAHQRDPHLLPIRVHLAHQPVACKRQRDQERDADRHRDIAHPVVMRPLLVGLGGQKPIGRIGRHHAAAKGHVAENSMDVERVPQRSMDHVPNVPQIAALFIDTSRGHHEPDPGVRQHHQDCPDYVEHDRHAHVDPLEQSLLHLVPAIVIDVNRAALRHEHQGVDMHHRAEDAGQIAEEGGIKSEEGEDQDATQDRG